MAYLEVQNGLWAQEMNFKLNEEVELLRKPKSINDLYIIDFYLSNSEITREIEEKQFNLSFETVNMVLTSATAFSKLVIPKNKQFSFFNIVFTRDWLFNNVLIDHKHSYDFFNTDEPICFSENLDYKLKELLQKIDFEQSNKLDSMATILQIIDDLFESVKSRTLIMGKNSHIHPNDLESLLEVRTFIDVNPDKDISLEMLSKIASMSLSKFKRLFKQIFGITPYQYHLANKMEKSMEVLKEKSYSISEIGFLMGYTNLSQFSKAFKNHFGILPSEVNV